MKHYYYIKMPTMPKPDHHVMVSNYANSLTKGFPPEDESLFVEVTNDKQVSKGLKALIGQMDTGDILHVPFANMCTVDVEEFYLYQSLLRYQGISLNIDEPQPN